MAVTIGIRELKNQTSAVIRRAQRGESITVTDRGRAIVRIVAVTAAGPSEDERLVAAVRAGRLTWAGGKPRGLARPPRFGASVSAAVIEDRR